MTSISSPAARPGRRRAGDGAGVAGQRAGRRPRRPRAAARSASVSAVRINDSQRRPFAIRLAPTRLRDPVDHRAAEEQQQTQSARRPTSATASARSDVDHSGGRTPARSTPAYESRRESWRSSTKSRTASMIGEHRRDVQAAQPADLGPAVPEGRRGQAVAVGVALGHCERLVPGPGAAGRGTTARQTTRIGPSVASASRRPVGSKKPVKSELSQGRRRCTRLSGGGALPGHQVEADADRGERERGGHREREDPAQAVHDPPAEARRRRAQPHRHVGERERQQQQPERAGGRAGGEVAPAVGLEARAARARVVAPVLRTRAEEPASPSPATRPMSGRSSMSSAGVPETPWTLQLGRWTRVGCVRWS